MDMAGCIRREEVSAVVRAYLTKQKEPLDFHDALRAVEAGGNGKIDFAELLSIVSMHLKKV
jgi:Ca2+-binding EF-hand superfamily protein